MGGGPPAPPGPYYGAPWRPPPEPGRTGLPWYRSTVALVVAVLVALVVGGGVGAGVTIAVSNFAEEAVEAVSGPDVYRYGARGDFDEFGLALGQCSRFDLDALDTFTAADAIDCEEPHAIEVYEVVRAPETATSAYDRDALATFADSGCYMAFEPFVGATYADSSLDYFAVVPSAMQWRAGSTTVYCVLFHYDSETLTGSARGSEI